MLCYVFLKITGISRSDAKRAPKCTRERTICGCRSKKCESDLNFPTRRNPKDARKYF